MHLERIHDEWAFPNLVPDNDALHLLTESQPNVSERPEARVFQSFSVTVTVGLCSAKLRGFPSFCSVPLLDTIF